MESKVFKRHPIKQQLLLRQIYWLIKRTTSTYVCLRIACKLSIHCRFRIQEVLHNIWHTPTKMPTWRKTNREKYVWSARIEAEGSIISIWLFCFSFSVAFKNQKNAKLQRHKITIYAVLLTAHSLCGCVSFRCENPLCYYSYENRQRDKFYC